MISGFDWNIVAASLMYGAVEVYSILDLHIFLTHLYVHVLACIYNFQA